MLERIDKLFDMVNEDKNSDQFGCCYSIPLSCAQSCCCQCTVSTGEHARTLRSGEGSRLWGLSLCSWAKGVGARVHVRACVWSGEGSGVHTNLTRATRLRTAAPAGIPLPKRAPDPQSGRPCEQARQVLQRR